MTDRYIAHIGTPGYMPDNVEVFDTAREAWTYLRDERLYDEELGDENADYGDTLARLAALANDDPDGDEIGSVHGSNPNYDGNHDIGLVYTVDYSTETGDDDD